MTTLLSLGAIPTTSGAMVVAVGIIDSATDNPWVSLGIAGAILVLIVVPMFRWLLSRIDKQQDHQDLLLKELRRSVDLTADHFREDERIHEELRQHSHTTHDKLTEILTELRRTK